MYLDFYRLKKAPFHITPDPDFLFLSPSHIKALGAITHGVQERQGFVLLLGEVGTGKTTILRSYIERIDPQQCKIISVVNPNLSFYDLLRLICHDFGVDVMTDDPLELITQIHQCLIGEYRQGRNVVLLIDEAQAIPEETLRHLRLLLNLEVSGEKPLQIVLAGQPELQDTLMRGTLAQVRRHMMISATIHPLTPEASATYIRHRLAKVATHRDLIFTDDALRLIVRQAKGMPRVLNVLCTNALIAGFGAQQKPITTAIVQSVITHHTGKRPPRRMAQLGLAATASLVLLAGGLMWFAPWESPSMHRSTALQDSPDMVLSQSSSAPEAVKPASPLREAAPLTPYIRVLPSPETTEQTSQVTPAMETPAPLVTEHAHVQAAPTVVKEVEPAPVKETPRKPREKTASAGKPTEMIEPQALTALLHRVAKPSVAPESPGKPSGMVAPQEMTSLLTPMETARKPGVSPPTSPALRTAPNAKNGQAPRHNDDRTGQSLTRQPLGGVTLAPTTVEAPPPRPPRKPEAKPKDTPPNAVTAVGSPRPSLARHESGMQARREWPPGLRKDHKLEARSSLNSLEYANQHLTTAFPWARTHRIDDSAP